MPPLQGQDPIHFHHHHHPFKMPKRDEESSTNNMKMDIDDRPAPTASSSSIKPLGVAPDTGEPTISLKSTTSSSSSSSHTNPITHPQPMSLPGASHSSTTTTNSSSSSSGGGGGGGGGGVPRRRAPPMSIPNFPGHSSSSTSASSTKARSPPAQVALSPSPPNSSPPPSSPFASPSRGVLRPVAMPSVPFQTPSSPFHAPADIATATGSTSGTAAAGAAGQDITGAGFNFGHGASTPWLALAATSGAPTPSLEGPGPMGNRASPHLGYPFERLNIGGSWSGANLTGEFPLAIGESGAPPMRRRSLTGHADPNAPKIPGSPLKPPTAGAAPASGATAAATATEPSADMFARYRAMAGRASVNAKGKSRSVEGDAPSGGITGPSTSSGLLPIPENASLSKQVKTPSPLGQAQTTSFPFNSSSASIPNPVQPLSSKAFPPLSTLPTTLILDLRPPSSFHSSHIPLSHSLPIPSTLLRRPAFDLSKLTQMLSSPSKEAVAAWREKTDIILLDADSTRAPDGSVMKGLAGKFEREGFKGHLWFLQGGHAALRDTSVKMVVDGADQNIEQPQQQDEPSIGTAAAIGGLMAGRLGSLAFQQGSTGSSLQIRRSGDVPATPGTSSRNDPFSPLSSSHTERPYNLAQTTPMFSPSTYDQPDFSFHSRTGSGSGSGSGSGIGSGSASMTQSRSGSGSPPVSGTDSDGSGAPKSSAAFPLRLKSFNSIASGHRGKDSHRSYTLQPANPFFDNIRQNMELSHEGITERISLELPPGIASRADELPEWMSDLVRLSPGVAAERLANEFYQVELKEQKRLQAVMDWHSKASGFSVTPLPLPGLKSSKLKKESVYPEGAMDSSSERGSVKVPKRAFDDRMSSASGDSDDGDGGVPEKRRDTGREEADESYFPFSISAGVERGAKNRYKNIWPYDYSRVKLNSPPDNDCDYINASYVQPRVTGRKYIATQGPLDATYCDFWTLVWEQGVKVIVMLTKQYEGGLKKCGNYWEDQTYGSVNVHLVSQYGGEDEKTAETTGFDFGQAFNSAANKDKDSGSDTDPEAEVENIHRVFELSNKNGGATRKVVQIQCTAWPDFDVPGSPDVLLNVLRDVNVASDELCVEEGEEKVDQPPIIVHCSAGVGRTGSFIIVDAIVDCLKRDRDALMIPSREVSQLRQMRDSRESSRDTTDSLASGSSAQSQSRSESRPVSQVSQVSVSPAAGGKISPSEQMDVDPPVVPKKPSRPRSARSDTSFLSSKEKRFHRDFGDVPILTKSYERQLTPVGMASVEGASPVASILQDMRTQRMSLVQSLRQYIFVHRAIIYSYLNMIDEDRRRETSNSLLSSDSASAVLSSNASANPSYTTFATFGSGTSGTSGSMSTREHTNSTSTAATSIHSALGDMDDKSVFSTASASVNSATSGSSAGGLTMDTDVLGHDSKPFHPRDEDDYDDLVSATGGGGAEGVVKRRASPTELFPDTGSPITSDQVVPGIGMGGGGGGARGDDSAGRQAIYGLSKRLSTKKMRPASTDPLQQQQQQQQQAPHLASPTPTPGGAGAGTGLGAGKLSGLISPSHSVSSGTPAIGLPGIGSLHSSSPQGSNSDTPDSNSNSNSGSSASASNSTPPSRNTNSSSGSSGTTTVTGGSAAASAAAASGP